MSYNAFAEFYDGLTGNVEYKDRAEYIEKLIKSFGKKLEQHSIWLVEQVLLPLNFIAEALIFLALMRLLICFQRHSRNVLKMSRFYLYAKKCKD